MKTKIIKTLAMALTVATAITATAVPTHAEETGTVVPHYTVGQDGIAKNGEKYVDANGNMIKNAFVADGAYTYFVQNDGTTMKNRLTYHPNGVSVIYFDENGHEVFDDFVNVKHSITGEPVDDLCYFNTFGEMYVDVVTYDKTGTNLYYANACGVIERNGWFTYSDLQGGGIGFANPDGTLLKDTYTTYTDGSTVYMEGDGSVRGSRTCAKHEHNWIPVYKTITTPPSTEIVKEMPEIEMQEYLFTEDAFQDAKTWNRAHPSDPMDYKQQYNKTLAEQEYYNSLVADGRGVYLNPIMDNMTPEDETMYRNFAKDNGMQNADTADIFEVLRVYFAKTKNYTKNAGFAYNPPLKYVYHEGKTEKVLQYYICTDCHRKSMTQL